MNANGKGSRPRPVDLEKYAKNYSAIFDKPLLQPTLPETLLKFFKKPSIFKRTTK